MHLGHARTFWIAADRAQAAGGVLILRIEDLDAQRSSQEYAQAILDDLHWLGIPWTEGPDIGGPHQPYQQSQRFPAYRKALQTLARGGWIYPCTCSRAEVQRALNAPHATDEEPVYPGTCRERTPSSRIREWFESNEDDSQRKDWPGRGRLPNWRFRVPDGVSVQFVDLAAGPQTFVAGRDFGDFVVWRHDQIPSYQLAVVVDDVAMAITEVVRGADLLLSTARQLLLYRAIQHPPPTFYHCPLLLDEHGVRLAKRHDALSLRQLRAEGLTPSDLRARLFHSLSA